MNPKELAQWLSSEACDCSISTVFKALEILLRDDLNSIQSTEPAYRLVESAIWGVRQAEQDYYASLK